MRDSKPTIFLAVTNTLTYDQRMSRICGSLHDSGYVVHLVGIKSRDSLPNRPYTQYRLPSFFRKGKFFYIENHIRLFFFLLFRRADLLVANDLDTALPIWLLSNLKRVPRLMDAHEYFTEMKEVISRPTIHWIWSKLAQFLFPRFPNGYTVGSGLAEKFNQTYGVHYGIIRNLPVVRPEYQRNESKEPFLLYQGAVNHGRGFEILIPAMRQIPYKLVICGDGNFMSELRCLIKKEGIEEKVLLTGMLPHNTLREWASKASIGIFLPDREGINQFLSLPNKFFDNIEAGLPQITCRFPEYERINKTYPVALLLDTVNPNSVANAVNMLMTDVDQRIKMTNACHLARKEFSWQQEEVALRSIYQKILGA